MEKTREEFWDMVDGAWVHFTEMWKDGESFYYVNGTLVSHSEFTSLSKRVEGRRQACL